MIDKVRIPDYWRQASQQLAETDPLMAVLVRRYEGSFLVSRGDSFSTLVRSIVGQQISVKAADSIWKRFIHQLPMLSPASVLECSPLLLRQCGLSLRKLEYIRNLAEHYSLGRIDPELWPSMSDKEIVEQLTAVRGIGVWTAEMFLIFCLLRPDVFPIDDIGLQNAVALHYLGGVRPGRKQLTAHGERWQPWRSVATWYLWRSLDPVPVEY